MDLSKLSTAEKIILGCGVVLVIDLLAFPWHRVEFGPFSESFSAIEQRNAFLGVLALLLTILIVVVVALRVFKPETKLPELPVPMSQAIFYATAATGGLLLLKLLLETDYLGFGSYLGILLAGGMAYGGFQQKDDSPSAA